MACRRMTAECFQGGLNAAVSLCFDNQSPQSTEPVPLFYFLVPTCSFYPHSFCYFTFYILCLTVSVPLTLSPSVLNSLHFNVERYPSCFFILDYDFGDMFPVLQSLPSADWEGGTLVNPLLSISIPCSLSHFTLFQHVFVHCLCFNAFLVLKVIKLLTETKYYIRDLKNWFKKTGVDKK